MRIAGFMLLRLDKVGQRYEPPWNISSWSGRRVIVNLRTCPGCITAIYKGTPFRENYSEPAFIIRNLSA